MSFIHNLKGRNFIVTGSTQGLGRSIALRLAEAGADGICICGRNALNGDSVKRDIEVLGTRAVFVTADLEEEADCRKVVTGANEEFGEIHGLVNAAGITFRGGILDGSVELWDRMMRVNARAPFIMMQETVRVMKSRNTQGSIVNMISDQAHGGAPSLGIYAASKGALATLTKNAAHALMNNRIRVNGVLLGWMATPNEHTIQLKEGRPENWLEEADRSRPFGRLLRPEDIAELALYLLSDASAMMTGSLIDFDQKVIGGMD